MQNLKRFSNITVLRPNEYFTKISKLIIKVLLQDLKSKGSCSIMLTGGKSAEFLYTSLSKLEEFSKLDRVTFYFGDERCVSPEDAESNYKLAMRTLFQSGIPTGCKVIRMSGEKIDCHKAAKEYADQLPECIDLLLLSVGEDGHIASLFPYDELLFESKQKVLPVYAPKKPFKRLTITPIVIKQASKIFVMAQGSKKAAVLLKARKIKQQDFFSLPARLVLNAIWFLDCNVEIE
jgi:6-phosphogluconolactonase